MQSRRFVCCFEGELVGLAAMRAVVVFERAWWGLELRVSRDSRDELDIAKIRVAVLVLMHFTTSGNSRTKDLQK